MIYTKNNNRENPVLEGNTFSVCCKCGKEVPVPLNELFRAKKDHPLSAKVICPECTKEQFSRHHPTLNDVVALTLSLCKLGFTRTRFAQPTAIITSVIYRNSGGRITETS